jgi:hypothetical protein
VVYTLSQQGVERINQIKLQQKKPLKQKQSQIKLTTTEQQTRLPWHAK